MAVIANLIVNFGGSAGSDAYFAVAELDNTANVDSEGEVVTSFQPGDTIYFLTQYDPTNLTFDEILTTLGDVYFVGYVNRDYIDWLYWENAETQNALSHIPSTVVTYSVYSKNEINISRSEFVKLTASGNFPTHYKAEYSAVLAQWQLVVPDFELADDEDYPLTIIAYFEAL